MTLTPKQAFEAGRTDYETAYAATAEAVQSGTIGKEASNEYFVNQLAALLQARVERGELAGKAN